ncbi:hypothetical protein R80B4_00420 [Fibrobacteres bacterium R8-0-B4]
MKRLTSALVIAATFFAGTAAAQIRYVAVVETEVNAQSGAAAKLNRAEVQEITAVLRNEARNTLPSGKYKIMTAESVIAQGGAVLEECSEENCVITLGAKIGADYIVRGTLSKFGTKLTLSIVMYETEDGTLVASARVSADKAEELLEKTVTDCRAMYKTFLSEQAQESKQKAAAQPTPPLAQTAVVSPPQPAQPPAQTYQQPTSPPPTPTYQQSQIGAGTITDNRDGKTYKTVVIGGKRWMGENLNYKKGKSWCYNRDNSNCDKYGRLYDWKTAKTVCPVGWHLPSRQEWQSLIDYAGGNGVAGKKLKAGSGWSNNGNGSDEYGFSAPPGGNFTLFGNISIAGNFGYWWTATESGSGSAYYRHMLFNYDLVDEYGSGKGNAFSVRCVQD